MNAHQRVQNFTCPCCGGYIGEAAPLERVREAITAPAQRLVFDLLSKAAGDYVSAERVSDRMYSGRRDGGPDDANVIIRTVVYQLRKKLEQFGWTVSKSKGGSGWKIIPVGRAA